jgi:prepilin-type N-terminal cleavage/methylation domain-containing protein
MEMSQRLKLKRSQESGFTLIELMAMMVIIGVIASVAVKKYTNLSTHAEKRAILAGITELNVRETLFWANHLIANGGYGGDDPIWSLMVTNTDLGSGYQWTIGPTKLGGELAFGSQTEILTRSTSTGLSAAKWSST